MSFIKVTDKESGERIDLNSDHILAFRGLGEGKGCQIALLGGTSHIVNDSPRSIRGYIKKAQGVLPLDSES